MGVKGSRDYWDPPAEQRRRARQRTAGVAGIQLSRLPMARTASEMDPP
jgi:hypothetical protein